MAEVINSRQIQVTNNDTCSPFVANIPPEIRQPIISSNPLIYWITDKMLHNSHNYNQGIPPPPIDSSNQMLGSSQSRDWSACKNYGRTPVRRQLTELWSRSPNVMSSPSTTPSSISQHTSMNRSPSHMSSVPTQQFSPSHSSHSAHSDSQHSAQKGKTFCNQNHNSSHESASNPLQSLQKMVMTVGQY